MAWPRFLRKLFGGGPAEPAPAVDPAPEPVARRTDAPVEQPVAERDDLEDEDDLDDEDEDDLENEADDEGDDDDDDLDDERENDDEHALADGSRHPELEADLRAAPCDTSRHLIYADWLQQHGNPRGELIVVQHALEGERDVDKRSQLRDRERALFLFRHDLEGPIRPQSVRLRLGFVRHLTVDDDLPHGEPLERRLAHGAYLLLETLCVPDDRVEDVRASLAAIGRDDVTVATEDELVPRPGSIAKVMARLELKTLDGQRWASVFVDDHFGLEHGTHSFLARSTLDSGRWSFGCDGSLSEDGLADDPVRTEMFPIAVTDTRITLELRFGITNDREVAMYFRGSGEVPREDGDVLFSLVACEALTGVPFEPSPVIERPAVAGPQLVDRDDRHGAVVPGHGVFGDRELAAPGAAPRSIDGLAPPERAILSSSVGGADGTLAAVYSPHYAKNRDASIRTWLALVVLPDGKPVHVPLHDFVSSMHALSGHRVAIVTQHVLRILDAHTGRELWQRPIEPANAALGNNWRLALVEHDGRLHVLRDDRVTSYAVDTGDAATPWLLPALSTVLRHGAHAFHPVPARAAWMLCASSSHAGFAPVSIIAWRDRDGRGGEVAVAEEGWAREDEAFGRVAVLPDGRIVAIGTSVWLVEPPSSTAIRLGDAGGYNSPLQLTREGDRWRLWNPGAGPWYLELD